MDSRSISKIAAREATAVSTARESTGGALRTASATLTAAARSLSNFDRTVLRNDVVFAASATSPG